MIRPISWLVSEGNDVDIFDENAYIISVENEGVGEYISVKDLGQVIRLSIDQSMWPILRDAIDAVVAAMKK